MLDAVVPENSSVYQCHVHDNYNSLSLQASDDILSGGDNHPAPDILHIPRRCPHERFDKSEKFVSHDAAPTKNYVFDSHWQQWRNNRSS